MIQIISRCPHRVKSSFAVLLPLSLPLHEASASGDAHADRNICNTLGGWTWGLKLESYGFGEKQTLVSGTPEVKAQGQRHSYPWDATVQGWFVNDRRGQEHGFTLVQRPRLPISEALLFSLTLSTSGGLPSHFTADSAQVQDASGLKVWEPPTS